MAIDFSLVKNLPWPPRRVRNARLQRPRPPAEIRNVTRPERRLTFKTNKNVGHIEWKHVGRVSVYFIYVYVKMYMYK